MKEPRFRTQQAHKDIDCQRTNQRNLVQSAHALSDQLFERQQRLLHIHRRLHEREERLERNGVHHERDVDPIRVFGEDFQTHVAQFFAQRVVLSAVLLQHLDPRRHPSSMDATTTGTVFRCSCLGACL